MSIKIDNMENARKAKKEKAEHKKSKKLTSEQQMEEDLKQILRVEGISKKLFGNVDTLSNFENTLSKLGDVVILPSRASSNGLNFFRVIFSSNKFSKFQSYSRESVYKKGLFISKSLQKLNLKGTITTALNFDGIVKSGQQSKIGDPINIYAPNILSPTEDDDEIIDRYNNIKSFNSIVFFVHIENNKKKTGGAGSNNDCLWYCLNKAIPDDNFFKSPESIKRFLKIGRNDMVHIEHIEKIEKQIKKVGINISGDFNYTSKLGLLKNIHLTLLNNHYQINHKINSKVSLISYDEKIILLVDKNHDNDTWNWIGYDGEKTIEMSNEFYYDVKFFKTKYIMVQRQKFKVSIEKEYSEYIKIADDLKLKSNGEINLYKTGTFLKTALKILDSTTKHLSPELILFDEAEIIQNTVQGSTIFYDEYKGEGFKSDIISMFPFIMKANNTMIPIKRGIFRNITNDELQEMKTQLKGNYAFGIYKMEISKSEDDKINRLFRFNLNNQYTTIDLRNADFLGLEMKLIISDDWNFLSYPRSHCLTGKDIFGKYIETIYKYKSEKVEGAKFLLNILSGAIGESNKTKIIVDEDDIDGGDIDLDEMNLIPIKITHSRDQRYTFYNCVGKDAYFKSQFARFKPFLWAQARFMMSKIIQPINNIVVKCITDGIITTQKIDCYNEMGKLKYEGYCPNIEIVNNAKPKGIFTVN